MAMYKCTLVQNLKNKRDGIVIERFFREADSYEDLMKDLNSFQWPKGNWDIEYAEE